MDGITLPEASPDSYCAADGWVFAGWDADFSNVTGNLNVHAIYGLLGDADCNGEVNFADISLIYQYIIGASPLTAEGLINADFDQNGDVLFSDISAIYPMILG